MGYVALDLEFNQFFNFPKTNIRPDPRCPSEIIQIGAVRLDDSLEITESVCLNVKPQIYKKLHPHIKRLTGITKDELNASPFFPDVFREFAAFAGGGQTVFLAWGPDDMRELFKNILYYNLNAGRVTNNYINVQNIANSFLKNGNNAIGLKAAVEALGIAQDEGRAFHNALSDALYAAEAFRYIVKSDKFWPDSLNIINVNISQLRQSIFARANEINAQPLFDCAGKKLMRTLTDREKEAVLFLYNAGQKRAFDMRKNGRAADNDDEREADNTVV